MNTILLGLTLTLLCSGAGPLQAPLPDWARPRWEAVAKAQSLALSTRISPAMLQGDFDGDGKADVALFVERTKDHKQGIVFLHRGGAGPFLVGAGASLGNGGDDFEWMDSWRIKPHGTTSPRDAMIVERESSASGLISFENGKYRWKQLGD